MTGTPLLILGAGSFAIETLEIAELSGAFEPIGFVVSEGVEPWPTTHAGLPVYRADRLPIGPEAARIVAGIVTNRRRPFVDQLCARGYRLATLVHPTAIISPRASLNAGCVIGAGAIIASQTRLCSGVLLNRGANIGHDNTIEAFATIGPGATLAGGVHVGTGAYVGVGAVVRDHLAIGTGAVVAAGAVVVKPVEAHTLVAGCPAVVLKHGVDGL